jgi:hypothetical protein
MLDLPITSSEASSSVIHLQLEDYCHTLQIIDHFVVLKSAPTLVQLGSCSWLINCSKVLLLRVRPYDLRSFGNYKALLNSIGLESG